MAQSVTLVAATGTLTFSADPVATDTVTIGGITYTYIATPAAAYDVDVAGTRAGSITNLIAAINRSGTPGATTYHADTVQHPAVSAAEGAGDTAVITARFPGTIGNTVETATSETDITFGAATLTGGTGVFADALQNIIDENQVNSEVIAELNDLLAYND